MRQAAVRPEYPGAQPGGAHSAQPRAPYRGAAVRRSSPACLTCGHPHGTVARLAGLPASPQPPARPDTPTRFPRQPGESSYSFSAVSVWDAIGIPAAATSCMFTGVGYSDLSRYPEWKSHWQADWNMNRVLGSVWMIIQLRDCALYDSSTNICASLIWHGYPQGILPRTYQRGLAGPQRRGRATVTVAFEGASGSA